MHSERKVIRVHCHLLGVEVELSYQMSPPPGLGLQVPFIWQAQPACTGQDQCPVCPEQAWEEWHWHRCPNLPPNPGS